MKKLKYLLVALFTFFITYSVYADEITCKSIKIDAKIPDTVHLIILFIQIAVPVLLVIFGSIDLVKAIVAGKEDEIKKAQNVFVRRLVTGILVFFVVVVVKLVFNFATNDDKNEQKNMWNCVDCFLNGTNTKSCKASK